MYRNDTGVVLCNNYTGYAASSINFSRL